MEETMAKQTAAENNEEINKRSPAVDEKIVLEMYRSIYATRQFELKCFDLYRQGFIRGYLHPYLGEEAVAAGACAAIGPEGYLAETKRAKPVDSFLASCQWFF